MLVPKAPLVPLVAIVLLGCPGSQDSDSGTASQEPLDVEEVTLPVDSALSTEADRKGPPIIQGVSGVMPSDYPRDLPTHEPSSVSDFGTAADGSRFVEFDSPSGASAVGVNLERRLAAAGWTVERVGGSRLVSLKAGRRVAIEISDLSSGSRIRVEYR